MAINKIKDLAYGFMERVRPRRAGAGVDGFMSGVVVHFFLRAVSNFDADSGVNRVLNILILSPSITAS